MKLRDIAILNLRRRKAKAAFMLAGLLVGVATMVALVGLAQNLTSEVSQKLEKYGANILITPKSESLSLTYEGLSLGGFSFKTREIKQASLKGLEHIENAANIAAVGPIVLGAVKIKGRDVLLGGVDFVSAEILKPWWKIQGKIPQGKQIVAGSEAARVLGVKTGSTVELNGEAFTVSGVLTPTGSQDDSLIFANLAAAQTLLGKPGIVSMVEVAALCKDCPVDDMVAQISKVLPGAKVMAIQSVVKGRMETLGHFQKFAMGVSALVALVGSLVVLVTMMASVRERTGEIGVFRAIGFRKKHVMRVVLWEAALISAAAGIGGYLAGTGASALALPLFAQSGNASFELSPILGGAALVMALVVGMGSAIYPAIMAARMDPSQALRTL